MRVMNWAAGTTQRKMVIHLSTSAVKPFCSLAGRGWCALDWQFTKQQKDID